MKRLLLVAFGLLALSGSASAQNAPTTWHLPGGGRIVEHVLQGGAVADSLTYASAYTSYAVPCFGAKAVVFNVTTGTANGSIASPIDSTVAILWSSNEDSTSFYSRTVGATGTVDATSMIIAAGTPAAASTGFVAGQARSFMLLPWRGAAAGSEGPGVLTVNWCKFRILTKESVEGQLGYKSASSFKRLKIVARVIY